MAYYANTNTNQALRDFRGMLFQMPVTRSQNELRSSVGKGAELQAMAGMKEHEMRLPALQLESQKAQDEIDRGNELFYTNNLTKGVDDPSPDGPYDVRITPDQAVLLLQDQKYGPPAMQQFVENAQRMGYKQQKDNSWLDKNGQPVTYRTAEPLHREYIRTLQLNTDYEKARDMQVLNLESKGELTPDEQARLGKLKALTPLQLAEKRHADLLQIQMQDPMWGRPEGKLLTPMIEQAAARVAELKGEAAGKAKMDWEREKFYAEERGRNQRAAGGGAPKPPSEATLSREAEMALRHGIGQAQAEGIPVDFDPETKRPIGQLNQQQFDRFNQIMKQMGHMAYGAPGEITTGDDDWIPFNEKQEKVYDLTDVVPASMPIAPVAGGEPGTEGAPQGLPAGAQQAPDGNYYIQQNGKYFRVDPVGEQPAQAPQNAPGAAQPGGKVVMDRLEREAVKERLAPKQETKKIEAVPIGEYNGMKIGQGSEGYVVMDGGRWRKPASSELEIIRDLAQAGRLKGSAKAFEYPDGGPGQYESWVQSGAGARPGAYNPRSSR